MNEKTASVAWEGPGKKGLGKISTETGALKDYPYGFASRFEDDRRGTNPEEILGAAHAACSAAMSIFTIFSIASVARLALTRSGSLIISASTVGTICHASPKRSVSQPHCSALPPFRSALQ